MMWIYVIVMIALFSLLYTLVDIFIYRKNRKTQPTASQSTKHLIEEIVNTAVQVAPKTLEPEPQITRWCTLCVNTGTCDVLELLRCYKENIPYQGAPTAMLVFPFREKSIQGEAERHEGVNKFEVKLQGTHRELYSGVLAQHSSMVYPIAGATWDWIVSRNPEITPMTYESDTDATDCSWSPPGCFPGDEWISTPTGALSFCFAPEHLRPLPLAIRYVKACYQWEIGDGMMRSIIKSKLPEVDSLINEAVDVTAIKGQWYPASQTRIVGSHFVEPCLLGEFVQTSVGPHILIEFQFKDGTAEMVGTIDQCPIELGRCGLDPIWMGYYALDNDDLRGILIAKLKNPEATVADELYGSTTLFPIYVRPRADHTPLMTVL